MPLLLQSWTTDRALLSRALGRIVPNGGTAMYDAVAEAIPLAEEGRNRKKALLLISDGNDTSSRIDVREVKQLVRESEVLVYAIGIDGDAEPGFRRPQPRAPTRIPLPLPFPPGRGRSGWPPRQPPMSGGGGTWGGASDDRVNVVALRDMTDDSGGRTEIVRDTGDLNPATASIANELNQQVLPGIRGEREGRMAAGIRSASKCARAPTACARGEDTWRASRMSACRYSRPPLG